MSAKAPTHWGPRWSRWVGRFLARIYWNTEVRGRGNIPRTGAGIVVVNHVGFIDGPVVHGVIPRLNYFLIRADMFRGPLKPLLTWAAQIPVHGDGRSALATGLAALRRGDIVGVFPEGTRGAGTASQVHGGAAWLAVQSGATIIPTALLGTRLPGESVNLWPAPRRKLLVEFGTPFQLDLPPDLKGRARQTEASEQLADALRNQLNATLATTDLVLPLDDPLRQRRPATETP